MKSCSPTSPYKVYLVLPTPCVLVKFINDFVTPKSVTIGKYHNKKNSRRSWLWKKKNRCKAYLYGSESKSELLISVLLRAPVLRLQVAGARDSRKTEKQIVIKQYQTTQYPTTLIETRSRS